MGDEVKGQDSELAIEDVCVTGDKVEVHSKDLNAHIAPITLCNDSLQFDDDDEGEGLMQVYNEQSSFNPYETVTNHDDTPLIQSVDNRTFKMSINLSNFTVYEYDGVFPKLPLGIIMSYRKETKSIVVSGFNNLAASRDAAIKIGDELLAINDQVIDGMRGKTVLKLISAASCPITIKFRRLLSAGHSNCRKDAAMSVNEDGDESKSRHFNIIQKIRGNGDTINIMLNGLNDKVIPSINTISKNQRVMQEINFDSLIQINQKISKLVDRWTNLVEQAEKLELQSISP